MKTFFPLLMFAAMLYGLFSDGIFGTSENTVLLVNATGLKIARVVIEDHVYEDVATKTDKILINVTPKKHDMELVFKGGTHVDWKAFDFKDVRQVIFVLAGNRVLARPE